MEKVLNPLKKYNMPEKLVIKSIDNKKLVISPETGNWLLLNNDTQSHIFEMLVGGMTVGEVLNSLNQEDKPDFIRVLTELEAKQFENTAVQYPPEHGMYFYLTNRCNQRCRHCYMLAGQPADNELKTEEVKSLLQMFAAHGGTMVTFTGGEATTRSDFAEIVHYAKERMLKVCVLSNGLLWSQELVNQTKSYVDEIQISIDGFDRESYQSVRGTDSFEDALAAVVRLTEAGVRVAVAVSPLTDNLLSHEEDYITFAKMLLDKYNVLVKFNTELMEGRFVVPTEEENQKYRQCAQRIKAACAPFSEQEGFALDHSGNTLFNNCGYGGLSIAANGDVYFCNLIRKCARQGNIRTDSFDDLLERAEIARRLSDVCNLIPCRDCDLKYLCGGGCRVKHFQKLTERKIYTNEPDTEFIRNTVCLSEQKEKIYRLMVSANPYFYR